MRTGKNNNNSGFSLIELVTVIALLVILIGVASVSIGVYTSRKVSKCADNMMSAMETTRVMTLGKAQNDVEFIAYVDTDGNVCTKILRDGSMYTSNVAGDSGITVTVYFDNEATGYALNSITGCSPSGNTESGLHLVYNRSSGAFMEKVNSAGGAQKNYCTKIVISGHERTAEIIPVGKTGKIVLQ